MYISKSNLGAFTAYYRERERERERTKKTAFVSWLFFLSLYLWEMLYSQHFHNIFITNPKGPFGWEDRKWEEGKVVG